jgi:RimJ/RimL family protein N-acetyltransferase
MRFIPRPVATEKKDVTELIERVDLGIQKNESINWAIALKESNQLIGTIGFCKKQTRTPSSRSWLYDSKRAPRERLYF